MSGLDEPISDRQLDRYLDGQLSEGELAEFAERLRHDPGAQLCIDQHRAFEDWLRRSFSPREATVDEIEALLAQPLAVGSIGPASRRSWLYLASGIAALVAWLAVGMRWQSQPKIQPFFEQRPLSQLYRETVQQGFRPYYVCEDEARFALTFRKRQAVPLYLAKTPEDRRMVGLSYLGGLSRDTTAMLCYASDQPVIVFVDRRPFDNPPLAMKPVSAELHVHRRELGTLVIYEVSPFETPLMAPYLMISNGPGETGRKN